MVGTAQERGNPLCRCSYKPVVSWPSGLPHDRCPPCQGNGVPGKTGNFDGEAPAARRPGKGYLAVPQKSRGYEYDPHLRAQRAVRRRASSSTPPKPASAAGTRRGMALLERLWTGRPRQPGSYGHGVEGKHRRQPTLPLLGCHPKRLAAKFLLHHSRPRVVPSGRGKGLPLVAGGLRGHVRPLER